MTNVYLAMQIEHVREGPDIVAAFTGKRRLAKWVFKHGARANTYWRFRGERQTDITEEILAMANRRES